MTTNDRILRKARVQDAPAILEMVNEYAKDQIMLPRSPLSVFEGIRDFTVVESGGEILGCGALHVVWGDLAEIRSIAVRESAKGKRYGYELGERLLAEAKQLGIPRVFAFTYVPGFFGKLGFRQVEHSQLPHKVFGDCMNCPKFNACDEIAMLLELEPTTDQAPMTGPLSKPIPGLFQGPFPTRVDAGDTKDA